MENRIKFYRLCSYNYLHPILPHARIEREKVTRNLFERTPTLYSNLRSDPDVVIYFPGDGVDGTVMIAQ